MDTELLEFRIEEGFSPHSLNSQNPLKTAALGSEVNLLRENNCSHYGKFYFSGLEKGQGITVANALRRVLLYDIFGIGLTKAKFHFPQIQLSELSEKNGEQRPALGNSQKLHEFSTVSGMKESILELLIHLRSIIWRKPLGSFSTFSGKLNLHEVIQSSFKLNKSNSKEQVFILQAKHLLVNTDLLKANTLLPQIVNPEQYLATFVSLKKNAELSGEQSSVSQFPSFEMDFELHPGSLDVQTELFPNQFLVESGPFFPIKKVNYTVELEKNSTKTLKVEQNSSAECVFFEIWTDGSIHPQQALNEAFLMLHNLFKPQF